MKQDINRKIMNMTKITASLRLRTVGVACLLALTCLSALAQGNSDKHEVVFAQSNLVSNIPGAAQLTDPDMTNAWGTAFSATSPFWINDNGTGVATLYTVTNDSSGVAHVTKSSLVVTRPGEGNPTGLVFDGNGSFNGDVFLFVSEDGTVSGWRPALGTAAEVLTTRDTAVYKGAALAMTKGGPVLLAANFAEATLDAFGLNSSGNFALLAQFSDPRAPAGFAPFNIREIKNSFFVTFALQNAEKHDDVAGPGNGLIDVFNTVNGKFVRFATGSNAGGNLNAINSPWGLALAPKSFGQNADRILVGNFGSGTIMTFNGGGQFGGFLEGTDGLPLVIDGLWSLTFGNGGSGGVPDTLYFTAGPNGESDGLFGMLTPVVMQKK
ncbi:MAG: hypothetical protein JWR26_1083 [Pedosphaera sp.]|nr:hypothetical protein [Pedosphaera sp.]